MKDPQFLYVGSLIDGEIELQPQNLPFKDIRFPHICATPNIAVAALLCLLNSEQEVYLEEYEHKLSLVLKKELPIQTVFVYMVPLSGFQRVDPDSNHLWISRHPVTCLDKINVEDPIEFAKTKGINIIKDYLTNREIDEALEKGMKEMQNIKFATMPGYFR